MKSETAFYLDKARGFLEKARHEQYIDEAGRHAYLAAFHAAQAYIFELKGKIVKTHKGVHNLFYLMAAEELRIGDDIKRFLPQAYEMKAIADYERGPTANVPKDVSDAAIATADAL